MKRPVLFAIVIAALMLLFHGIERLNAQNPTTRDFNDFVKDIPKPVLLKLRGGSKQAETAAALSKQLTTTHVGQEGTFRIKVVKIEAWPFPQESVTGWRVYSDAHEVKEGSYRIQVRFYGYAQQDPAGILAKAKLGKELILSGKIWRCDITATGQAALNIDLSVTNIAAVEK